LITSATTSPAVILGQAGQIQAPSENIAQFQSLLKNVDAALQGGNTSFAAQEKESAKPKGTLLEEAAVNIDTVEKAAKGLEREVNRSTEMLTDTYDFDMNGGLSRAITYQKFSSAAYFMNLNLASEKASGFSEEVSALTKGR
jgi:hypothetical protein